MKYKINPDMLIYSIITKYLFSIYYYLRTQKLNKSK